MSRIPIAAPDVGTAEMNRVADVMEDGQIADGPEVRAFEDDFADYCGAEAAVGTSNGTTALHAALVAAGVGDGDRVLTTPFTFIATANAVRLCGADPVFTDVDPATYNLDPDAVEARLGEGVVDAILAVHLYGLPAPMEELASLAEDHDVPLIEDAAQAHGATVDGRHVGTFGDAATFSFYPTKNMTTAEGGIVTTDDERLADRVRSFINHGRTREGDSYAHARVGHNFRMTSIAAAIGQVQLEKLPDYVETRRRNAARFTDVLEDAPAITAPAEPEGYRHSYHQYTVRCEDRGALKAHLDDRDVDTAVYYPRPVHEQPAYEGYDGSFPHAERASDEVLSLPVHPGLEESDVDRIVEALEVFDR
jgi:dTDP-4-amino-4,6-dideoxygalactose transaminase